MSTRISDRRDAPPAVAVESDSADLAPDFLAEVSQPDEAWTALVPEHLKGIYLGLAVPDDVAASAVQGKIQIFEIVDVDPAMTDKAEYNELKRRSSGQTPGARQAIHEWRLNEAARLHDNEQMKRRNGYYAVECPSCSATVYQSMLGTVQLDNGNTFTGCQVCRDALDEEHRRRADLADPILTARRAAVAAALGEDTGS